eukprot:1726850-Karenia_brevis.AAC.1
MSHHRRSLDRSNLLRTQTFSREGMQLLLYMKMICLARLNQSAGCLLICATVSITGRTNPCGD